jgi:hypothetical protein
MRVERVSFSFTNTKGSDKIDNTPFLYTPVPRKETYLNKYKYSLVTAIVSAVAVIITLINLRKRI